MSPTSLGRQAGKCPNPVTIKRAPLRPITVRCKARRCSSCGVLWAGDTRRKLLANIEAYGGAVGLVTATAPGTDGGLVWDEEVCKGRPSHTHSGRYGCRVRVDVAHAWNCGVAPAGWTRMHRAASQAASRYAKSHGGTWGILARAWEFQARGLLHTHVAVPMETLLDRRCSQLYANELARLAPAEGFGNVDTGRRGAGGLRQIKRMGAKHAARYVAKYIASAEPKAGKLTLSETVTHRDVPGQVVYVSRKLTTATGVTMRTLRHRRWQHKSATTTAAALGGFARLILETHRAQLVRDQGAYYVDELVRALGP